MGGTAEPLPRRTAGPVASQRILKLTLAGTLTGPKNRKLSSTHTSWLPGSPAAPQWLTLKAWPGSSTTQNGPEGWTPPM